MKMLGHYYKQKVVKLGIWSLLPGDIETWHGEYTNRYFKKLFGIGKGILLLNDFKKGFAHAYVLKSYLKKLYRRIDQINGKDPRALEKKLKTFYKILPKAKTTASQLVKDPTSLSDRQLIREFFRIRDRIHHLAIYDQFGWLAEEYWALKMDSFLTKKLKLKKGSKVYHEALFGLTQPERISTTLLEKKAVIKKAIAVRQGRETRKKAAKKLAKSFGWMPVFCYGIPWTEGHYESELKTALARTRNDLQNEYRSLINYSKERNRRLGGLVKEYSISEADLQIFTDFSLAIDIRNEAEYFVSFGGFYLLPLYAEFARRLYVTTKQVRQLYEKEMFDCLLERKDAQKLIETKGGWGSVCFDEKLTRRINITGQASARLFRYIESYVKLIQGGDPGKGMCANPGKAIGTARIVPAPGFNDRVKDGDILFTYATTTDYLPAMKRAAAFVTEVGGLTCHAAVVAREFNVPCVVSLKNAMKNFKDGDRVEVDADKGIVRKLSK